MRDVRYTSVDFPFMKELPVPADKHIALRVSPAAERAIRRGHPWIYAEAIEHQSHFGNPGDLAVIFDKKREFLAVGLFDPTSPIRVRILHRQRGTQVGRVFFHERMVKAASIRSVFDEKLKYAETDGYRLIYGENDGLPGLVVDRYQQVLVVKLYTVAWIPHLLDVVTALLAVQPARQIVLRLSRATQQQEKHLYGLSDGLTLFGPTLQGPVLFHENGLIFEADPVVGQKTGFFLDQRENRSHVEFLSADRSVLNVFAYTGGFSVYAARGGAKEVVSVDISKPACKAAKRNMQLNEHLPNVQNCQHEIITEDAFVILKQYALSKRSFDLVILDPPMFAHKQNQVPVAIQAYQTLTRLGLDVLKVGGTLVQASCSSKVNADQFYLAVHQAASDVGRPLQEIERTGHPIDHPIRFQEGAYLKCLFARAY